MDIEKRIKTIIEEIHALIEACGSEFHAKIKYLTIFSQSEEDFTNLRSTMQELGEELPANNGYKYQIKSPRDYLDEHILLVRIRKPDIHRKEFGCADLDYKKEEYANLRDIALEKGYDIIIRKGYEMIELSNQKINAYAYLVKGEI